MAWSAFQYGMPKNGQKSQTLKVDGYSRNCRPKTSIFRSIFRAYGIPLLKETNAQAALVLWFSCCALSVSPSNCALLSVRTDCPCYGFIVIRALKARYSLKFLDFTDCNWRRVGPHWVHSSMDVQSVHSGPRTTHRRFQAHLDAFTRTKQRNPSSIH